MSKSLFYKYICHECTECVEVPSTNVKLQTGIGAGRDYDGGYDSGSLRVDAKCNVCNFISHFNCSSVDNAVKNHYLFKVYKGSKRDEDDSYMK